MKSSCCVFDTRIFEVGFHALGIRFNESRVVSRFGMQLGLQNEPSILMHNDSPLVEQKEALIRRFAAVVAGPYPFQNKHAAAVALRSLGHGNLVQEQLVNPTSDLSNALSGDSTYKCPYSSPFDAK